MPTTAAMALPLAGCCSGCLSFCLSRFRSSTDVIEFRYRTSTLPPSTESLLSSPGDDCAKMEANLHAPTTLPSQSDTARTAPRARARVVDVEILATGPVLVKEQCAPKVAKDTKSALMAHHHERLKR